MRPTPAPAAITMRLAPAAAPACPVATSNRTAASAETAKACQVTRMLDFHPRPTTCSRSSAQGTAIQYPTSVATQTHARVWPPSVARSAAELVSWLRLCWSIAHPRTSAGPRLTPARSAVANASNPTTAKSVAKTEAKTRSTA